MLEEEGRGKGEIYNSFPQSEDSSNTLDIEHNQCILQKASLFLGFKSIRISTSKF